MLPTSNDKSSERDQHARYVELCALLTTGSLSGEDLDELDNHLMNCVECQRLVEDFHRVVRDAIPLLASREEQPTENVSWRPEKIKRQLFAAIGEQEQEKQPFSIVPTVLTYGFPKYIAVLCLLIFAALGGYVLGSRQHSQATIRSAPPQMSVGNSFVAQIAELTRQRDNLDAKAKESDRAIERLSSQLAERTGDVERLKQLVDEFQQGKDRQTAEISTLQSQNGSISADHDRVTKELEDAQTSLASLTEDLNKLKDERVANLLQTANMQKSIDDLTAQVSSRDSIIEEQKKFLASDRDIVDLMGARDLLIADVSDVDPDGHSRKAFGRVFYTKDKSLQFYAFDLDRDPGMRDVNFQVWGSNTSDKDFLVNMGILYMDNKTNRRWVLKFNNPTVMKEVDSVFVTAEPKGGSVKPSGKQRLYAYLRTAPNHP